MRTAGSSLSAVPEPSEWAAISFGVLGMVWVAKRRFMPARA
ncbi:MAG: PEP-CTERM sorting domain-containing protein [Verrucomicrobiota bacterium]